MATIFMFSLLFLLQFLPIHADFYENYTCENFGGQQWLNDTYDLSLDQFSTFWSSRNHWFTRMRHYIVNGGWLISFESRRAGFTFPILEATNWNETEWSINPQTGRLQRNLSYDIDPKTAFIDKSTVSEAQVVVEDDSNSFTFLRTLTNKGFPFSDTFQVEFLLCATEDENGVHATVKGKIVDCNPFYWLVQSTVEGGVYKGAEEYYGIFDFSANKFIEQLEEMRGWRLSLPIIWKRLFNESPGLNDPIKTKTIDDLFSIIGNLTRAGKADVDTTTSKSPYDHNFWGYDTLTVMVISLVALVLIVLTFIVRRQKV